MQPSKCARCGALIDPLALACPYCRFTTPAGLAAHERAEQERRARAHYEAVAAEQQRAVDARRAESAGRQALVASLVGLVLCCTPAGIVAIVLGVRARKIAAKANGRIPGTATVGIVLGAVSVLSSIGFFTAAQISSHRDSEAAKARIAAIEASLGDAPSQPTLAREAACGLAEIYALQNGWDKKRGHSLEHFQCPGRIVHGVERADLEDFQFKYRSGDKPYRVHVCFSRGAKWYVSELRASPCSSEAAEAEVPPTSSASVTAPRRPSPARPIQ